MAPTLGQPAPDFTLPSTSGEKVTLSKLKGQTVMLAFFPLAFSSTCTEEFCTMRDDYSAFAGRNVKVLPISVDHTHSLRAYIEKYEMPVEMLSDFHREVSKLYGVFMPERNYANRAYFLIDGGGVLRWSHVEENPSKRRQNAELLAAIDAVGG
jgi:peroxiredoxin (alkyl hydroperoxide reductase subunit C)